MPEEKTIAKLGIDTSGLRSNMQRLTTDIERVLSVTKRYANGTQQATSVIIKGFDALGREVTQTLTAVKQGAASSMSTVRALGDETEKLAKIQSFDKLAAELIRIKNTLSSLDSAAKPKLFETYKKQLTSLSDSFASLTRDLTSNYTLTVQQQDAIAAKLTEIARKADVANAKQADSAMARAEKEAAAYRKMQEAEEKWAQQAADRYEAEQKRAQESRQAEQLREEAELQRQFSQERQKQLNEEIALLTRINQLEIDKTRGDKGKNEIAAIDEEETRLIQKYSELIQNSILGEKELQEIEEARYDLQYKLNVE